MLLRREVRKGDNSDERDREGRATWAIAQKKGYRGRHEHRCIDDQFAAARKFCIDCLFTLVKYLWEFVTHRSGREVFPEIGSASYFLYTTVNRSASSFLQ